MSALAGCYWRDGRPASEDDLRISTTSVRHRVRAPFRFRAQHSVVLAYADRAASCQPFHDPESGVTLIVDGYVDELEELSRTVGAPGASVEQVVLSAWRRWDTDIGAHLLGDYVLVVSDERKRRVVCIRAPLAQRPLFYSACSRAVVFGSEIQQVVRHPAIATGVDEGMVAEYLSGEPATVTDTLWRDVHRLAPAHLLEIDADVVRARRYWDFDPQFQLPYKRTEEYADHLHEIFTRAVRSCVRDVDRAGVLLSGGVDSSSVAGVAQSFCEREGRPAVHAFTIAFPGRPCDETTYSQAVVERWALDLTRLEANAPSRDDLIRTAARYLDVPPLPNSLVGDPLRARAAASGMDVMLTGFGGDDFFSGVTPASEFLRQGRIIAWARAVVSPRLSQPARDLLRPLLGARRPRRPWIHDALVARTALDDRLRRRAQGPYRSREEQQIHRTITSLEQILGDEMEDRASQAAGVPQRHPFYDRRVAEFGLALPPAERSRGDEIKIALRHALGAYLPPAVAARVTLDDKAEFSSTYVDALEGIGGREAFGRLQTEDAGWVDGDALRQMYDRMIALYSRGDDAYIACTGPLWAVAALELWLDAITHRPESESRT